MPQSIYQGQRYIGETVQTTPNSVPAWRKAPVWNWVGGIWVQLNADIGPVDFALRNLAFDRVMIEIFDSQNFDHVGPYEVTLNGVRRTDLDLPDNTSTKWITGLTANTTYTVKIRTALISGGYTPDSVQTFTTPDNPTPATVIDLTSPSRTNAWTDLSWSHPGGSAVSYRVYYGRAGEGPTGIIDVGFSTFYRVVGLQENTAYWYFVRGVNASGLEGANSNQIQWATGWGEIRRQGSDENIIWKPREWGSYRPDIQWRWAREYGILDRNPHLYQGYWPGNNWHGASNPSANLEAGRTRRYTGCVVYTASTIRDALNAKHGAGVGDGIVISKIAFRRVYRNTNPGNVAAQDMVWHLTSTNPFNSGQPPIYGKFSGKAMKAGEKIDYYPLASSWGTKLIRGYDGGTAVNGIALHRSDDVTNGYGAAGYGRWSGHLLKDPDTSGDWRYSDLRLMMEGSWNVLARAYRGPYQW
jgi:hypothetical protein